MLLALTLITVSLSGPSRAGEHRSGPLVFAGCGSNLPIVRVLAQAFRETHPEVRIEVMSVGSTSGIWTVAGGAFPVGLVSRPLREHEKTLGLTVMPYARTALVLAAHPSVADDDITPDQLAAIYRGAEVRWRDGQPITVFTREQGASSVELLRREIQEFAGAYDTGQRSGRLKTIYQEQRMNSSVATTPYALGLSDLGALTVERLALKVLKINGVAPSPENVLSGRYPLVQTLAFVFREEALPDSAQAFLTFVRSEEGRRILLVNAYLPAE